MRQSRTQFTGTDLSDPDGDFAAHPIPMNFQNSIYPSDQTYERRA